jgi:hypothetical protein
MARGPSAPFAPGVSVCTASSAVSCLVPAVLPAFGMAPSLPNESLAPSAIPVKTWPQAEPPPLASLPVMDVHLSPSPVISAGSFMHLMVHDSPVSASYPFNNFNVGVDATSLALLPDSLLGPRSFGSVHRVVTCPRMLGFWRDGQSYACINLSGAATLASPGRLIVSGANICITGDIGNLFDVVEIPPLPISVAVEGDLLIDDCCTAHGWTLLQLDDGSIYWQDCYYCKNVVETIISPQAIVDSSDVF